MSEPTQVDAPKAPEAPSTVSELDAMKEELSKAKKELDGYKTKESSLRDRVLAESQQKDKEKNDVRDLETALTFNLTSREFLKNNESVLPNELSGILQAADKETYGSAIHKANAIKSEFIQSFFSQQSNIDLLTDSQKSDLADFQKLTKNWREAKSNEVYKNIFEPALSALKRVKKAEELARSNQGFGNNTSTDQAYKEKLQNMAERKYFRGKN